MSRQNQPADGSIPARAGETAPNSGRTGRGSVYPRTGGGNGGLMLAGMGVLGLSPHGRGKPVAAPSAKGATGSIPARAGETGNTLGRAGFRTVYPRTGGGNGISSKSPESNVGLSPHGRGKQRLTAALPAPDGSIPARAGETSAVPPPPLAQWVYPRTGGGNAS